MRRASAFGAAFLALLLAPRALAQDEEPPAPVEVEAPDREPAIAPAADPAPSETAPSETAPSETAPSETAPSETAPSETAPSETAPPEAAPPETAPSETAPFEPGVESPPADVVPRSELGAPEELPPPDAAAPPHVAEERELVTARPSTLLGRQAGVWLELGTTAGGPEDARAVGLSGELGMRYRVADSVVADVSFGLTYAATDVRGETVLGGTATPYAGSFDRVEPGNPTLGGAFVHRDASFLAEVGLAMAIPTAARDEPGADADGAARRASSEVAARTALAMRGYRSAFRWAPERFSLAIPFRLAIPLAPVVLEVDGALAAMFPVIGDRNASVDTLIELGLGAGTQIAGPLAVGARLAGVGAASGSTTPAFTLSAEPWVRLRFDPVQLTLRGVLDLTGADRLGGSRGPSFGVFLGAGVEL